MPSETSYRDQMQTRNILLTRAALSALPKACGQFIRSIESTTTSLTRLGYARDLRLFFHFLQSEIARFSPLDAEDWTDARLGEITADDIERYLEYLTYYFNDNDDEFTNGEMGKLRKLSALRSFFQYLFKNERIPGNVAMLVDMPKRHEKPILRLEIDEVARILDIAETGDALTEKQKQYHARTGLRDLTMLTLFLGTGIRVSECVGLNIDDLDFETGAFLVTRKGGNQVILYFPEEVEAQLKKYLSWRRTLEPLPGHEDALFLSLQMKRMGVRAVENMVKKYAALSAPLKKRISPHKLRSTFGTNLYRETGDIYLVADVLGHADVNTTRRHYAAMSEDRRRMAAKSVVLRERAEEVNLSDAQDHDEN